MKLAFMGPAFVFGEKRGVQLIQVKLTMISCI